MIMRQMVFRHSKWLVFMAALLAVLLMSSAAFAADWTKFQSDNVNSGVAVDTPPTCANPTVTVVDLPNGAWYGTDVPSLIIEESGARYAYVLNSTSSDSRVYKINCSDGSTPAGWTNGLVVDSDGGFQLGTPVINGATLYLGVTEGDQNKVKKIENINTSSPTVATLNTISEDGQFNTPFTYDGGCLYFGLWGTSGTSKYYKIDAGSGNVTTFTPSVSGEGFYWAGAAVIGDYLVFGGDKSMVYVLDKSSMSLVSSYTIKGSGAGQRSNAAEIRSSICYNSTNNEIYFTDKGGYLWCLGFDPDSGDLTYQWDASIGYSTSSPVYDNGNIYVGQGPFGNSGKIYCYDRSNGSKLWEYSAAGGVQSSPVIYRSGSDTYIYYTTNNDSGKGYCLKDDGSSRTLVWTIPSSGGTYTLQGMAASGNYAVFGNDYGEIYIIN